MNMSRLCGVLILLLIAVIGVQAQDDPIYGLITVDLAEVRAGPDFAYNSIAQLPLNASVQILGRAGDFYRYWDGRQWLQILLEDGRKPWIYARLVRTSVAFNSIPPVGRILPRDRNGRVPEGFDLTVDVCQPWVGSFTRSGDFMSGDDTLTVTYPLLQGANVYSVIVFSPSGARTAFDSETNTAEITLDKLPFEEGTYTWEVAPYWTTSNYRYEWQQVCLLQEGGTFEKPGTKRGGVRR
jgi:hypothetical protein